MSKSQEQKILSYLQRGNSITAIKAINLFGCLRLAARINDLRNSGYNIITKKIKRNGKTFASYQIAK